MNLEELRIAVNSAINSLHEYENPKEISVLINLKEPSIGARTSSAVKCANMGFDWEHGQFRIEPEKHLVRKGNGLKSVKQAICCESHDINRKYYICPICEGQIAKNDKYCKYCGQKLRE
jgi:hypothetical protein